MEDKSSQTPGPFLVFVLLCLITLPSFFNIYRTLEFHTIPTDPYAPFLLYLTSHGGQWPGLPFGYRILSIIPAVPLYYILPLYKFSLLRDPDLAQLKAFQALAAVSYLSIAGSGALAFATVRQRLQLSTAAAAFAALLSVVLLNFSGWWGVDPIGIFVIFALLLFLEQPRIFCPIFCLAPFVNEKIVLFFVFLAIGRLASVKDFLRSHTWQVGAVFAGLAIYIFVLQFVRLPGNELQTTASLWIPHFVAMSMGSVSSLKAIILNVFPSLVIILPCLLFSLDPKGSNGVLAASDVVVPLGLLVAGLTLTEGVTVGHVVSFAIPLTVISCALLIARGEK